jgi:hypothetical protein
MLDESLHAYILKAKSRKLLAASCLQILDELANQIWRSNISIFPETKHGLWVLKYDRACPTEVIQAGITRINFGFHGRIAD